MPILLQLNRAEARARVYFSSIRRDTRDTPGEINVDVVTSSSNRHRWGGEVSYLV